MKLPFDPFKDERNRAKHRFSLDEAIEFEWRGAVVREDKRFDYPEPRYQAIGRIGERIVFLVFAMTDKPFRPISLRLAEDREIELWKRKNSGATTPSTTKSGSRTPSSKK